MTDHTMSFAPAAASARNWTLTGAVAAAIALFLYFLPEMMSGYWLRTMISVTALVLASLSVSLLYAQLGMISLAQYALLGVGGWFALRIAHGTGLPFELALLGGGLAAALVGLVTGLPALRMRGLYLAIVTLMTAGALQVLISAFGFPDGGPGILGKSMGTARQMMERPLLAGTDEAYFRYAVVVVAICYLIVWLHIRGRPGRAWAMIRRGEICALAGGVNIVAYKVWAFTLAGFLAGISGGLLAGGVGQLDATAFPASQSIMLFAISVIGGAYSWIGPIIAGLLLRAFPALLNDFRVDGNIATIIFGIGLLHALTTAPNGIAGQLGDFAKLVAAKVQTLFGRART
ncbi:branched-chain amino acid ABC transporter permease [Mesorhizobium sp. L-8-3]|uniref:branched-chain amino acid ABC transporter permease n=1 Tax=Mesorhizobium sp. L-8-3 TaxID=2744522 RepID=UPI001938DD4B|nr:branched-chain amino acid ABC transporter permease [Mesorhizobium sp. L-8-3]BCH22001.1 branched-chain amino acid ABC transporter permease [Mesorhizobium sp. L-8-3]